ncbi:MAG: hypothetical protein ACPGSB_08115, partial [Opitutales bacterium]
MADLRSKLIPLLFVLGIFGLATNTVFAQAAANLGDQELNQKITELIKQNEFLKARPFLLEMKKRLAEQDNKEAMEAVDFFLASGRLEQYQKNNNEDALKTAVKEFEAYVSKYP